VSALLSRAHCGPQIMVTSFSPLGAAQAPVAGRVWPAGRGLCTPGLQWVKKIPPWGLVAIFPKRLGIFQPSFTCLLRIPIYARLANNKVADNWIKSGNFLFNYLQLWRSYAILSVTTQFTSCAQYVHHRPKRTLAFSDIFPKQLGIFSPNFTRLLNVHMHARMQIFIQLSPSMTKLCHIKCDHPAYVSVDGGHFEHIMVVVLNMA